MLKKTPIHIVPVCDMREHAEDDHGSCWCLPRIMKWRGATIIAHNSADGRELVEQHGLN